MKRLLKLLFYAAVINFFITQTIDTYTHPDMTRTRVLLRITQTYLWDFSQEGTLLKK